jgi:ribulose 1,5-bisphosphate synthetase/thiazole synthase
MIQKAALRETKIFAIPYVDLFSFDRTIPNVDRAHQIMQVASDAVKAGARLVNIGFIEDVKKRICWT